MSPAVVMISVLTVKFRNNYKNHKYPYFNIALNIVNFNNYQRFMILILVYAAR